MHCTSSLGVGRQLPDESMTSHVYVSENVQIGLRKLRSQPSRRLEISAKRLLPCTGETRDGGEKRSDCGLYTVVMQLGQGV